MRAVTHTSYSVIEHSEDGVVPFGSYLRSSELPQPQIGEVILLRWLDGREAYQARIFKIAEAELHVTVPAIFSELAGMAIAERVLMFDALSALYCVICGKPPPDHTAGCKGTLKTVGELLGATPREIDMATWAAAAALLQRGTISTIAPVMGEPKTTDYCRRCGESPESATHLLPLPSGHDYEDPRQAKADV